MTALQSIELDRIELNWIELSWIATLFQWCLSFLSVLIISLYVPFLLHFNTRHCTLIHSQFSSSDASSSHSSTSPHFLQQSSCPISSFLSYPFLVSFLFYFIFIFLSFSCTYSFFHLLISRRLLGSMFSRQKKSAELLEDLIWINY